jgi:diaminohydroxyphosphoribosylaminopyrimidine deaminase / 5-amino-6-(5-phosphoribosylamino)uracil reductase
MNRCLDLAALGTGTVAPNPLVGCVIVHDNKIIGEGYHQAFGGNHAEVNAIESVTDKTLLPKSTVYVNLEPCAHHGKTPPCADLLVKHKVKEVVIANVDPFKEVSGKGIQRLKDAGIIVTEGILSEEGKWLNRRFFGFHEKKRPYIILKWAQTIDGFIDIDRSPEDGKPALKITGHKANKMVHRWRTEEASILVGRQTVAKDNPKLTARHWPGASPLRLVIDPQLQLDSNLHVLSDGIPTWIYNAKKTGTENALEYHQISDPSSFQNEIATHLYEKGIQSVIIEGGRETIKRFYESGLWDEARIFTNSMRIGSGLAAPKFIGKEISKSQVDGDMLQVYIPA